MAREEIHNSFYHDILTSHSYVDTRLSIQTAVADFLAQAFFGKDFKRVVYTNPEYAFRKRLQILSQGIQDGDNISVNNVNLPFCSFHLSSAPETIKTAAASEWNGYYDETIDQMVHFIGTNQKCTVQFFFNRSDDATVAFEIAQREALAEYPIRYAQEIFWRNKLVQFPVQITVKKVIAGNESFDETAWLEKAHLFAMTLELEIETVKIHIHRGLNAVQLPFKWHATGNIDTWENGEIAYYTQKCILMWANKALEIDTDCTDLPQPAVQEFLDYVDEALIKDPQLKLCDENTIRQIQTVLPNNATAEIVEGFFKDTNNIAFNKLMYNAEKTTISDKGEVTAWFDTVVKPSSYQFWDYTEIYVPSREKGESVIMKNCKDKNVQIDGLHPNSTYTIYFIAKDISGNFNTIPLKFTTPIWKDETLPAVSKDANPTELTTTIEKKEIEGPTIIKGKGLIGLTL